MDFRRITILYLFFFLPTFFILYIAYQEKNVSLIWVQLTNYTNSCPPNHFCSKNRNLLLFFKRQSLQSQKLISHFANRLRIQPHSIEFPESSQSWENGQDSHRNVLRIIIWLWSLPYIRPENKCIHHAIQGFWVVAPFKPWVSLKY